MLNERLQDFKGGVSDSGERSLTSECGVQHVNMCLPLPPFPSSPLQLPSPRPALCTSTNAPCCWLAGTVLCGSIWAILFHIYRAGAPHLFSEFAKNVCSIRIADCTFHVRTIDQLRLLLSFPFIDPFLQQFFILCKLIFSFFTIRNTPHNSQNKTHFLPLILLPKPWFPLKTVPRKTGKAGDQCAVCNDDFMRNGKYSRSAKLSRILIDSSIIPNPEPAAWMNI